MRERGRDREEVIWSYEGKGIEEEREVMEREGMGSGGSGRRGKEEWRWWE